MHTQVLRGLGIANPALLDQPYGLKLELPRKLPPLHDAPPVPLKHLTWCLRNRVQATLPLSLGLREVVWVFLATSERWKHACEHLEPQIFLVAYSPLRTLSSASPRWRMM